MISTAVRCGSARHRLSRSLRRLCIVGLALVIVLAGSLVYVGIRSAAPRSLPVLDGRYTVGRVAAEWTDRDRTDPLAPVAGRPRRLSVFLWYPAAATTVPMVAASYAPGAWAALHLPGPVGLAETSFAGMRPQAVEGAPVARGRFPVVVFEPGLGFAALQYSAVAEHLASHGYIVVGVTPTYSANLTVLDGRPVAATAAGNPPVFDQGNLHEGAAAHAADRLVAVWADDAIFAAGNTRRLGRGASTVLAGHVDGGSTVYLGHSFGGAAALQACRLDPRCLGAGDLDGTQYGTVVTGLSQPILLLASQSSCVAGGCAAADGGDRADRDTARRLLTASTGPAWCYRIEGAEHLDFTDYGTYYLAAPLRQLLGVGVTEGPRTLTITNAYLTAFLNQVTGRGYQRLLDARPSSYPEVQPVSPAC